VEPAQRGSLERLALRPTGARPAAQEPRLVERILVPEDLAQWQIDGARGALREPPEGIDAPPPRVLRLTSAGEAVEIVIPCAHPPQAFNRMVVRAAALVDVQVRAVVYREGRPMAGSSTNERLPGVERDTRPYLVVLDLPLMLRQREASDVLVLHLEGASKTLELWSIDLLDVPLSHQVPTPDGEPELVLIGQHERRGLGLSTARPLETELLAQAGAELRFSYGIPEGLRYPEMAPQVRVTLRGERGEPHEQSYPLEERVEDNSQWHSARISLGRFAGERVRARFELAVSGAARESWCVVAEPLLVVPDAAPPTVLLVTSDTHRADHVAAAGLGVELLTPGLDELAARGVLFTDCFSSTNVTNPSHTSLMTGVPPRDTGVTTNFAPLSRAAPTLAEAFAEQGWSTFAAVSAPHLGERGSGLGQGFDRMSTPRSPKRPAASTVAALESWLADAEGQPLFVWLHLFDAHTPYGPPPPFDRLYYPKDKDPFDPRLPPPEISRFYAEREMPGLRDLEFGRAQYKAEVSYLDSQLRRVLEHPRLGWGILAVTGDHGESLGQHEIFWDHAGLYPDSIHVPMLLAWPQGPRGLRVEDPVLHLDLGRTLLDLAGLAAVAFPGESLLPLIEAAPTASRPRFALSVKGFSASVTKDGWHLILHLKRHMTVEGGERVPARVHAVELYDLRADRGCTNDRAREERVRAKELRRLLIAWLDATEPRHWDLAERLDADTLAQLAMLGYTQEGASGEEHAWFVPDGCDECAALE
jgi:arylsulfatase A-like enzyme